MYTKNKKYSLIFFLIFICLFIISSGCIENNTNLNETALNIALNDSELMKSIDNNYSVSSIDKCIQHWEGPDGVHDDEYICVEFQKEIPVNRLKTITAYVDVKNNIVHHIYGYPVRIPPPPANVTNSDT